MQSKEFSSISLICKTVTKKLNQIGLYCKVFRNHVKLTLTVKG